MSDISEGRKDLASRARNTAKLIFRHENIALVIVLFALIGIFSFLTKGLNLSRANIMNTLLQSATRGVAAIGQTFVILTAGIDLSVGGVGLMCAVLGSVLMTTELGRNLIGYSMSPYMAIPIMLLAGAAIGGVSGLLVSRIGVPPLIVTLGMWRIGWGIAFAIGGGACMSRFPEALEFFGRGVVAGVRVPVIIFIAVAAVSYFVLMHTTYGRSVYATGGNPVSTWLTGIRVPNIRLTVFIISGFLAGLAGVVTLAHLMACAMQTLEGLELDSIASCVVGGISLAGGRGSLIGTIIGVLIIGFVNNGMTLLGAGPDLQSIVKGVIIVAAVAVDYIRRR